MKYLLHGDDTAKSRNFLQELTEGFELTILEGKSLALNLFEENLVSSSLFEVEKAVVVENLISKNAKKKEFVSLLNNYNGPFLTILWEDKKLTKTQFGSLKNFEIKEFLLPQYYFQFLDSFTQGNGKRLFSLYHELLTTYSEEQVFYSLLKRLRILVVLSGGSMTDEIAKMAPWQISKLKQQLRQWKNDKLLNFYKTLQETEIKLKSGRLPLGLSKHLDILILSEL